MGSKQASKLSRITALSMCMLGLAAANSAAQPPSVVQGDVVPRDVREIYDRGLDYLEKSQGDDGAWRDGYQGPGTTGMAVMVFLASGEDPNFGQYSQTIRKALRWMIRAQNGSTGYMGDSMYQHGFAMLALAEAYGTVDESTLWETGAPIAGKERTLGEALELAARCAITSQERNLHNAWRYSPTSHDADTSVSGAVLMGLLAARNAGIEVPDKSIDSAIKYFASMTGDSGAVGYTSSLGGLGQSIARTSIASLVFSIAKRKDLKQFEATKKYLISNMNETSHYEEYARYYEAQALFQADLEAWEKWNRSLMRQLKSSQNADGSFDGQFGKATTTSLNLLSLALNFRFLPIYER